MWIAASVAANGFYGAVVAQRSTGSARGTHLAAAIGGQELLVAQGNGAVGEIYETAIADDEVRTDEAAA